MASETVWRMSVKIIIVLILVLVEDGFREFLAIRREGEFYCVLILVLVEDGFRVAAWLCQEVMKRLS